MGTSQYGEDPSEWFDALVAEYPYVAEFLRGEPRMVSGAVEGWHAGNSAILFAEQGKVKWCLLAKSRRKVGFVTVLDAAKPLESLERAFEVSGVDWRMEKSKR
jgi:hypothetical protein